MTSNGPSPKTALQKTWIAVSFVVFGMGGFWLLSFCWVALVESLSINGARLMNPFLACPLALAGALMMLFGAGEWGRLVGIGVYCAGNFGNFASPLATFGRQ
jgi:hypothetical protein